MLHAWKKRPSAFLVFYILFIFNLSLSTVCADESTLIHPAPQEAQVGAGQTTTVAVRVEDVQALYGLDIRLGFDPQVVEVVDADPDAEGIQLLPGDLLSPDFFVRNTADNAEGTAWFAMTQLNPSEAVSGSGTAFSVIFRGKDQGTSCSIDITYAKLSSRDGEAIPADTSDGTIRVVQADETAPTPTEITPPPQSTLAAPEPTKAGTEQTPTSADTSSPQSPSPTATSPESTSQAVESTNTPSPSDTATPQPTPTLDATDTPRSASPTATEMTQAAAEEQQTVEPTAPPPAASDTDASSGASSALWFVLGGTAGLLIIAWGVQTLGSGSGRDARHGG